MGKWKRVISTLLVITLITGLVPFNLFNQTVYAAEGTMTNSSTVVDLDELKSKVTDENDTDNDGVVDQIEKILGTDINNKDTDNDGLHDKFELENGLDPLKADTNDDGMEDLVEILEGNPDREVNSNTVTVDTDNDGTPNIEDEDNDNDGIKDYLDISPFSSLGKKENYQIKVITTGKATFLKIQLTPADIESLYKNKQIMNWPIDKYGQISDFDGSKEDIQIVPMLEVNMEQYPSEEIRRKYGYVLMKNDPDSTSDDRLWIPLQYLEQDGKFVGLVGTIYLPEKIGNPIAEDKYEVELELRLVWSMNGSVDNITKEWRSFKKLQYDGKDVKLYNIDYARNKEYIGSDIGDLNGNGKPDLAIFWIDSRKTRDANYVSFLYRRIFYDLVYDEKKDVYKASSRSNVDYYLYNFPQPLNKEKDSENNYNRIYSGKYSANLDYNEINIVEYSGKETLVAAPLSSRYDSYYQRIIDNRGKGSAGAISIIENNLLNGETPEVKQSLIRDSFYKYDSANDVIWYLYEIYNKITDTNELILKKNYKKGSYYTTDTEVLLTGLPSDNIYSLDYKMRDLARALSLDIYDVNGDSKEDLLFTTRTGRMYIITDCYGENLKDRIFSIPDKRSTEGVEGQSTRFYDFNNDGAMDLVSVLAERRKNYNKTSLTFKIGIRDNIEHTKKFLSKEYEAFALTGLSVEEANGVDTAIISGENTSEMLKLSVIFDFTYMFGNLSIDDVIDEVKTNVLEDEDSIDVVRSSYDHIYTALMDMTKKITEDIGQRYEKPKPLFMLFKEENRYLNLDQLTETNFADNEIYLDVKIADIVTRKQMLMKWVKNRMILSQLEINDLVDENPEGLIDFEENKIDVKSQLAFLNLGNSRIVGVGTEMVEAVGPNIRMSIYDYAKRPDQAFSTYNRLVGIKYPVQTIENVG